MQMKKWFASKEGKKITVIIFILCMVLIVQILSFLHFNKKLYDMSLEHLTTQVEELSVYVERNFQAEIEHYVHMLKVTELQLEKERDALSTNIVQRLQEMQKVSGFQMTGASTLDGIGVDATGDVHNILYKDLKKSMEKDEVYISNVLKNGNEMLIFIAVPLKVENEISAILWGKVLLKDIVENIDFTKDAYKYFQIIDDKGNYLLSSKSEFGLNHNTKFAEPNIWDELKKYQYKDGKSAQKIYDSVQRGEKGNFYFESDEQGCYVSYRPLQINSWYLFSVQVEDGLHTYVSYMRDLAINFFVMLTIGLLIIFGVIYNLIYTMYKDITKQHYEMQTINAMFRATLQKTNNIPFTVEGKTKQVILYGYPTKDVVQYCSFADMHPDNMLKKGIIDEQHAEEYKNLYQSLIVQEKKCEPIILYAQMGEKKEWLRVSIISDTQSDLEPMIGVLEGYSEQKQKDMQIESHLDDIKKIEKKSQTDFLTKLYNRETFIEKLEFALQQNQHTQQTGAFLILDLDHFKAVNDCMGHGMGDVVLQKTADTLQNFFRKEDIIGRLGGDEFVVFAQDIKEVSAFEQRIKQLNDLLCKKYVKDGHSVQVSASIGIKLTNVEDLTFHAIYEKADQALYQVKQAGRNGYQIYSEQK